MTFQNKLQFKIIKLLLNSKIDNKNCFTMRVQPRIKINNKCFERKN